MRSSSSLWVVVPTRRRKYYSFVFSGVLGFKVGTRISEGSDFRRTFETICLCFSVTAVDGGS